MVADWIHISFLKVGIVFYYIFPHQKEILAFGKI